MRKPHERLEKALARVAQEQGVDQERLRRWVSFLALCGALDRAIGTGILAVTTSKAASPWNCVSPRVPVRPKVAIQYRTRAWQTIEVDVGPASASQVDLIEPRVRGLVELGIPVVSPVRCLNLAEQVAQKLHACTGPASAGRARDVLDILLIDSLGQLDYAAVAEAARRVFAERATHGFPPTPLMPSEWGLELESMAVVSSFG